VSDSGCLSAFMLLYETAQFSYSLVNIFSEVEVVQLGQSELAIVVIQNFSRNPYFSGCFFKIETFVKFAKFFVLD